MKEIEKSQNFKINSDFFFQMKSEKASFTSALPDMNEIFTFEGASAKILLEWFNSTNVLIEKSFWEKKFQTTIADGDWEQFIAFVKEKKLILPKS